MTVAEYIVNKLYSQGINHIFGYIGAKNIALIEAVYEHPKIKFVNSTHEHSAAFAACAYAQVSGVIGVATSTSGPGGTNMLTGIANAYCDGIATLFITGQCGIKTLRNGLNIRNNSTQEVDIVAMATPITKYTVCVTDATKIRYELEKCLYISSSGRPGPVLLDLPEDLQFVDITPEKLDGYSPEKQNYSIKQEQIALLKAWIKDAERPVILLGNGSRKLNDKINALVQHTNVPIAVSFEATDACDNNMQNYLGLAGNNGLRCANFALTNSDLIISIGCSFWSRYTGADKSKFAMEAKVVRVDIDSHELNARNVKADELKIHCSSKQFFDEMKGELLQLSPSKEWTKKITEYKKRYYFENKTGLNEPCDYMYMLSGLLGINDIVVSDVGQHQIWALQALRFTGCQRMLNSGGLSTMGYALPAAIGAHYATPDSRIFVIIGDGGLQMSISELETIIREKLPVTVIVMNNRVLGVIKQLQDTYYGGKHYASVEDYSVPDFTNIAKAYGIDAITVASVLEFERAVRQDVAPLLINVPIDRDADVRPRIIQRRPIDDMYPFLSDEEWQENMLVLYERKPI